ncbi:hypothetical protein [Paenibacillus sp. L3-i20]|uniref:hypothetical protein n=1 Tax=Paenibacillus sp. L3-i20 TaxID=2905833 RepID=UPI001EDD5312|nr:hypothetical protein [Paenibacillus sp. L3-i20]GKU76639.1 hypothetical protein L3i20_v210360 [Paenibacillus sp. L3-i20]
MVEMNVKKAVMAVKGKGNPIVFTGTTKSGKTTGMSACAKNEGVQEFLSLREANGKGGTSEVELIATDCIAIPEDSLIVSAKLGLQKISDCSDDNELLGSILYSAAKDFSKQQDPEGFKNKIQKTLQNTLQHPSNDSLGYKIKGITEQHINRVLELLNQFPIDEVMNVYNEMIAKTPKKGQQGIRIFIELISSKPSFSYLIEAFWNLIVEIINQDVKELRDDLVQSGADFEADGEDFIIVLNQSNKDNKLVKTLLQSEDGSKEYLISEFSLIFRGAEGLYQGSNRHLLTVVEYNGQNIRCLRLIDTQGLFHATGVKSKEESERIIDMLSQYHSNKLVIVINSHITDTVKDGYEAIRMMLQETNREIEIYLLYTHWDEYLKTYSQQRRGAGKFDRGQETVDWEQKFKTALADQEEMIEMLRASLELNQAKKKPKLMGVYRAAILTDPDNKMEDFLEAKDFVYPEALNRLLNDLLNEQAKHGSKPKVTEGIERCIQVDLSQVSKSNISSLYNNLVVDCKGLKLYASTVRACIRKWCKSGTKHKSNVVVPNDYGYAHIETEFVQEIRNYTLNMLKNRFQIDAISYIPDETDREKFREELTRYLFNSQEVGREVAELIGKEAHTNGFEKNKGFAYQYDRFKDMLQHTQDQYFNNPIIDPTPAFDSILNRALQNCVRQYVDANCIMVF